MVPALSRAACPPGVPAKTAEIKFSGGQFSQLNFSATELLYDKEEKWVELFDKVLFN